MKKIIAVVQVVISLLLILAVLATVFNLLLIFTRPETISVVNTLIGQGVLIVCLPVIARVLFKKGLTGLKQAKTLSGSDTAV